MRRDFRTAFFIAALGVAGVAGASPSYLAPAAAVSSASQGIAVLGTGDAREEAFTLARAVYASSLRPRGLDELRARIVAGDPAPPAASKEVRDLAELRAAIKGDDAPSRQLLTNIAGQLHVQALLVVTRSPASGDAGDAGDARDAGDPAGAASVHARLFLADSGEFDAARYEPAAGSWEPTVKSLARRYPPPGPAATAQVQGPAPKMASDEKSAKPFYLSPWLWGAVGAAVLVGGFIWFGSQDTSQEPIHLQMRVPR